MAGWPYIEGMKQITVLTTALFLAVTPVMADTHKNDDVGQGLNLVEDGMKQLLRGMIKEMGPAKENLRALLENMGPMMLELQDMIGDVTKYQLPEMLPNGDIIIRRKVPLKPVLPEKNQTDL